MGCNCSKTDASAEVVPAVAPKVPVAVAEAPVQKVAMHQPALLMIENAVPQAAKGTAMKAEKSDDFKDAHESASSDKISASKKKRMKQRERKTSPQVVPSTIHESKVAEALVNQSADQAYFSADSEVPKKDIGQIRKGAKKNKPAART